jgi:hypothetical protein
MARMDMRCCGMANPLDDPQIKARTVRNLLVAAPFLFVGCYALAAVQGAERWACFLIAGIALAGCLGTALSIHGLGSDSRHVLTAVIVIIALVSWWLGVK